MATKKNAKPRSNQRKNTRKTTSERNRLRKTDLKIISLNIRGLRSNIGELAHLCRTEKPHVVVVVETLLDSSISECDEGISIPGYNIACRKDRNANGGGIIVYCLDGVAVYHDESNDPSHLEVIWFSIILKEENLLVAAVYRPPSSGDEVIHYLDSAAIQMIDEFNAKSICLLGDFNVHHKDWLGSHNTDRPGKLLLDLCNSLNLVQTVTEPTRLDQVLDLVLTDLPTKCTTLPNCGTSDHKPVLIEMESNVYRDTPFKRKVWKYKHADYWGMRGYFTEYNWNEVFQSNDPEECCTKFTDVVKTAMDLFIPSKTITNKVNDKPWFNDHCRKLVAKKRRLHNIAKASQDPEHINAFNRARSEYNKAERKAKAAYRKRLRDELTDTGISSKKWWKTVNSLSGKSSKTSIPVLKKNESLYSSAKEKSEVLADTFANKCKIEDANDTAPEVNKHCTKTMSSFKFKPKEIRQVLKKLNIEKATGMDQIPNRILKVCHADLATPLCRLYQLCFDNGTFPSQWKNASVVPLHKRSSKSDPSMYRPISLLSNVSKVMEAVIAKSMRKFFLRHNLISNRQFGFRPKHSTSDVLTILSQHWSSALDEGKEVFVAALDIKGAFDRVWHNGLCAKLEASGITGKLLMWIKSYLSGRSLNVILNGQSSKTFYINASVPQGSILGPLLFSVFINDLTEECENELFLYADDANLFSIFENQNQSQMAADSMNNDLSKIKAWSDKWKVIFEPQKCQAMVISRKRSPSVCNLIFNGVPIPLTNEIKILGATFDSKLTWKKHISNVAGRAGQKLGALRRVSRKLDPTGRATVYKSQVRSVMEFSPLAWMGAAHSHLAKLDSIQSRALKIIGVNEDAAAKDLNIHPLQHRRNVAALTLMYKLHTNSCPEKLKDLRPPKHQRRRTTRLNSVIQQHAVERRRTRTLSFDRTFTIIGASLWNSLPDNVVGFIDTSSTSDDNKNIKEFKSRVNKYLLEKT